MKKDILLLLCVGAIIGLFSCQNGFNEEAIHAQDVMILEIDPENSKKVDPSGFGDIELITLSSDEEFLLGDIDKLIVRDHKLFLKPYNRGKLYIFSDQGEEFSVIDQVGTGPGEYLEFTDFDVDSTRNQVVVVDGGNRKVLTYSYEGVLINEVSMDIAIKFIKAYYFDGDIQYILDLGYFQKLSDHNSVYSINLYTRNWEFISGYFKFSEPRMGMIGNPYMLFSKSSECIGYYKTFSDSIFHIENNRMSLAYQLKFPIPVMTYGLFEADPTMSRTFDNYISSINYDESSSYLFLGYMYKSQSYFTLFNKNKKEFENYALPRMRKNCSKILFSGVLGLNGSKLVIECSPEKISCLKEVFKERLSSEQILKLDEIDEYDNSILLFVELK